jgi:protein-S-isoprenylcysteine O-methyltransferase Ste14
MLSLFLRNLFFTILQPGVVAVLVPYWILRNRGAGLLPESWGFSNYAGLLLMAVGWSIALACIVRFATEGEGTLSPLDPTKKLVVHGLYRYSRNPMYVGVTTVLAGEALFWWSRPLAIYAVVVFLGFNLFILLHEEPRLKREFGSEYDSYRSTVRRWI